MSVTTTHEIEVPVAADTVYEFLADVENWADVFPPTVHARRETLEGNTETIQIWATVKGSVRNWTSTRIFDSEEKKIQFAQAKVAPPASAMTGVWKVSPINDDTCQVSLIHHFDAGTPEEIEFIRNAVDFNSARELEAITKVFNPSHGRRLYHRTEDEYTIDSTPDEAFAFLLEAESWPHRIPHVADAELTRFDEGGEYLKLTTRSPDGSTHQTGSYRVELPGRRLVYKQDHTPGALISHRGEWQVDEVSGRTRVTSIHHFGVSEASIENMLGPGVSLDEAVDLVAKSLVLNSATTIKTIDQWTQSVGK
ncbi:aromatase/cyclase [Leucobacter sp. M11]|uniref:aromatase/cyclase n=1 Tax=Leucobacter sp. M11 TaxID=2993565 RepID=UPI002D7ECEA9|nr:aromatase/cyclase [Leucobacter sp. M11]